MRTQLNILSSLKNRFSFISARLLFILLVLGVFFKASSQEKRVNIDLSFHQTDSLKQITAIALEQDCVGQEIPIEGLDIYFYVQRSFSLLPIGSVFNTTDESGKVEIDFPLDLPGDENGNIILIVKVEDSPPYRDTTLKKNISWGVPLVINNQENKRTLWAASSNAPLSLIFLVNSILLVVWGLIIYILSQLYLIWKESTLSIKDNPSSTSNKSTFGIDEKFDL